MTAKYMIITVAACQPAYVKEALGYLGAVASELKDKANCVGARYGVAITGMDAGRLVMFQSYEKMGDIERVFEVYA